MSAHGQAQAPDHAKAHDRKTYYKVFAALGILTVIEIVIPMVAHKYGDDRSPLAGFTPHWSTSALYALSIAKAALVGLFFMHLKFETKWLKFIAVLPAIAIFYAVFLGAEAMFRFGPPR
jgi:cytochrome c oxidase subunit IV